MVVPLGKEFVKDDAHLRFEITGHLAPSLIDGVEDRNDNLKAFGGMGLLNQLLDQSHTGKNDALASAGDMLIAATAMGLGSVWIDGFNPAAIREILAIPENVIPLAVVYFGYPAEKKEPRTQYIEEAIYWQKYDPEGKHKPRTGNLLAY